MDGATDAKPGQVTILDRPWADVLDLPERVSRTLSNLGAVTVRDVVALSDQTLMAIPNFGRTALRQLRDALAAELHPASGPPAAATQSTKTELAAPIEVNTAQDTTSTFKTAIAPLVALDDVLDRPWIEVLDISVRVASGLYKLKTTTVREVVALSEMQLLAVPNFGRKSLKDLRGAIESALGRQAAGLPPLYAVESTMPRDPEPRDLTALFAEAHRLIYPGDLFVFEQFWVQEWTVDDIAWELSVSLTRVRQRLRRCKRRAGRLGKVIRRILGPVEERMRIAGGIIHASEVEALAGPGPLRGVPFLVRAADMHQVYVWEGEFLTDLSASDLRHRVSRTRDTLRGQWTPESSLEETSRVVKAATGLLLNGRGLSSFLTVVLGRVAKVSPDDLPDGCSGCPGA